MISAVIGNADSIGKWLNGDDFELVVGTKLLPTYRTIGFASWQDRLGRIDFIDPDEPDKPEFFVPRVIDQQKLKLKGKERNEKAFPDRNDGQTIALFLGLKLAPKGAIAVFCGRKTTAESLCDKVVDAYDRGLSLSPPVAFSNHDEAERLAYLYTRNLGADSTAALCAKLGIFTHHGNTPHGIRLAVEHAMKHKKASFVICTSTLAQGVNLPIRYLIVTSVYQGSEPISVRDFHNLIGRAGRADEHTEGSILFADPEIYDKREWRWRQIKKLLQPENSEPCTSSLLSILEPLRSDDQRYPINIGTLDIVSGYIENTLAQIIEQISSQHEKEGVTKEGLDRQIAQKVSIISAIENYLMAYWDESKPELQDEDVIQLTKGTLAYFLASEEQKKTIMDTFLMLAHNIEQKVTDAAKRKVYGRTLYGLQTSIKIEEWVKEHIGDLLTCHDNDELLAAIWPVLAENISNNTFRKCDPPVVLYDIAQGWTRGKAFDVLFTSMANLNVRIIAGKQRRQPKLESVVDICENGFAYDGTLVVAAITEIIGLVLPQGGEAVIVKLLELQKRLKYGLPSANCVAIYELGFADRMVSIDLSQILGDVPTDRRSIIQAIKRTEQKVRGVLARYPSYFIERLDSLL